MSDHLNFNQINLLTVEQYQQRANTLQAQKQAAHISEHAVLDKEILKSPKLYINSHK